MQIKTKICASCLNATLEITIVCASRPAAKYGVRFYPSYLLPCIGSQLAIWSCKNASISIKSTKSCFYTCQQMSGYLNSLLHGPQKPANHLVPYGTKHCSSKRVRRQSSINRQQGLGGLPPRLPGS